MSSSVFEIDTKGTCLFCLNPNCAPFNENEAGTSKFDFTTATAFRMLFRHLKIDIRKVGRVSSSSVNLSVRLCDACFFLVDEFLELYQSFEQTRLKLDECTWKLKGFIMKGMRDEGRVREYQRRVSLGGGGEEDLFNAKVAGELRKETLRKCSTKLATSIPKIRWSNKTNHQLMNSGDLPSPEMPHLIKQEPVDVNEKYGRHGEEQSCKKDGIKINNNILYGILSNGNTRSKPRRRSPQRAQYQHSDSTADLKAPYQKTCYIRPGVGYIRRNFNKVVPMKCHLCDRRFADRNALTRHHREVHLGIRTGARGRPEKCMYCLKFFSQKSSLCVHQYQMHALEVLAHRLPAGVKELDLRRAVERILNKVRELRDSKNKPICASPCPLCEKKYYNKAKVRVHLLRSHIDFVLQSMGLPESGEIVVEAPAPRPNPAKRKLEENFDENVNMKKQVKTECDDDGQQPQQLNEDEDLGLLQEIGMHELQDVTIQHRPPPRDPEPNLSSNSEKPAMPCDVCGETFFHFPDLKKHNDEVHLGRKKKFQCAMCNKTFTLHKYLQVHFRKFHLKEGAASGTVASESWGCDYCDKTFPNQANLRRHAVAKHAMALYSNRIPPHITESAFYFAVTDLVESMQPPVGGPKSNVICKCSFCGRLMRSTDSELRLHILRLHLNKVVENADTALRRTKNISGSGGDGDVNASSSSNYYDPLGKPYPLNNILMEMEMGDEGEAEAELDDIEGPQAEEDPLSF